MKRRKQRKVNKFNVLVFATTMFVLGMVVQKFIIFGLDAFITIYR